MLTLLIRTILIYVIVTAAVRLMGKRQVSDMQTSELVITLIISQIAALPLENAERPLLSSLVPIMMIAAIELLISLLMMKSRKARSLICGHPIVIIKDGRMIESQLRLLRISREDVYTLLREKDHADESGIKYGVIEPNGSLSILTDADIGGNGIQSADLRDQIGEAGSDGDNAESPKGDDSSQSDDTDAPNGENDSQSDDTGTTNEAEQDAQAGGTT